MILLDTNVISALMWPRPEAAVIAWLDARPPEAIWTTAVTVFEIEYGLAILNDGRRRRGLKAAFEKAVDQRLGNRILPFDVPAALASARFAGERRTQGRPVDMRDVQIAGIARVRKATLATRNLRHFEGAGVPLVDPWSD